MSNFWEDDLDIFFNANTPGCYDATWNATTIKCILGNPYALANPGEIGVEDREPTALVKTSDVTGMIQGQNFVVNGITYKIRGIQPSGDGVTLLILSQD